MAPKKNAVKAAEPKKPNAVKATTTTKATPRKINPDNAIGVFARYAKYGIGFTPSKTGGTVTIKGVSKPWEWDEGKGIPRHLGIMAWIAGQCPAFKDEFKVVIRNAGSSGTSRKGKKITSLAQLDAYSLQDLQVLAAVVQEGIKREQEVADIDRLIAAMQSRQAGTVEDLLAKRAALRPAPLANTAAGKRTAQPAPQPPEGDEPGTVETPEATVAPADPVTPATTDADPRIDQPETKPEQPSNSADTPA
jgi:hypothetical protein